MHGRFSIIGGTCPGCPPKSMPMRAEICFRNFDIHYPGIQSSSNVNIDRTHQVGKRDEKRERGQATHHRIGLYNEENGRSDCDTSNKYITCKVN